MRKQLDLDSDILELKVNGESFELTFPTLKEADQLQKMEKDGDVTVKFLIDFFVQKGLPQEIAENLQSDHVQAIFEAMKPDEDKKK